MTFAEQLYDFLQHQVRWTLHQARLVRILESNRPDATMFIDALDTMTGELGSIEKRWAMIEPLLPQYLPEVMTALGF